MKVSLKLTFWLISAHTISLEKASLLDVKQRADRQSPLDEENQKILPDHSDNTLPYKVKHSSQSANIQ